MTAPTPTRRAFLAGSAAAALAASVRARAEGRRLNVLYLSGDEHHPGFMANAGHPLLRTPNLDRLATEGVRVERSYVTAPVCAPTRTSWLTGQFPQEHGQLSNRYAFDPRNPTLVEAFAKLGYHTACFGKLHTNGQETDGSLGFQRLLGPHSGVEWEVLSKAHRDPDIPRARKDPADQALITAMPRKLADAFRHSRPEADPGRCGDEVLAREAERWLRARPDGPFFAYVSFRLPHYPFDIPEPFYYRFNPAELPPPAPRPDRSGTPGAARSAQAWGLDELTDAQRRLLVARYLGAVEYVDHLVGRFLDLVDTLGLAGDTLVVYSADHGDMADDKGLFFKQVMFEGAARKPMLMRLPGVLTPGARYEGLVSEVDVLPTLAGLVGEALPLPEGVAGRDLSASLRANDAAGANDVVFAYHRFDEQGRARMAMARDARFKVVRYDPRFYRTDVGELYDLVNDPREEVNLATDPGFKEVRNALLERLKAHEAGMHPRRYALIPAEADEE